MFRFILSKFNKKVHSFKDVLEGKIVKVPNSNEPCCRLRFLALANVRIFSYNEYLLAKIESSTWPAGTVVAVASGRVFEIFVKTILPKVNQKIVLIVVDYPYVGTDSSVTNYKLVLENRNIQHLFAENWLEDIHQKLTIIPIGVESPFDDGSLYGKATENQFLSIASQSPDPINKPLKVLVNAHLNIATKPASGSYNQRGEMVESLRNNPLCEFWIKRESRVDTWALHTKYSFEICPEGNGLDTHRFYEALWLKTIPIVKTNSLTPLYKKFSCLIVDSWHDINETLLLNFIFKTKISTNLLTMEPYIELIEVQKNLAKKFPTC